MDCPVRGEAFILSPRGQGTNRRQVHRASQKEVDLVAVATLIKGSYLRKVWGKHMGLCKDVLCCVVYKSKREKGNNPDVSQLGKETMVWPHNGIAWSHRNDDVAMSGIGNVGKTLTTCCRLKEKKNEPNDAESDRSLLWAQLWTLGPGNGGPLGGSAVLSTAWLSLSSTSSFTSSFLLLLCSSRTSCCPLARIGCLHGGVSQPRLGVRGCGTGWSWWGVQGQHALVPAGVTSRA